MVGWSDLDRSHVFVFGFAISVRILYQVLFMS